VQVLPASGFLVENAQQTLSESISLKSPPPPPPPHHFLSESTLKYDHHAMEQRDGLARFSIVILEKVLRTIATLYTIIKKTNVMDSYLYGVFHSL
jgi:hypothetical protein